MRASPVAAVKMLPPECGNGGADRANRPQPCEPSQKSGGLPVSQGAVRRRCC